MGTLGVPSQAQCRGASTACESKRVSECSLLLGAGVGLAPPRVPAGLGVQWVFGGRAASTSWFLLHASPKQQYEGLLVPWWQQGARCGAIAQTLLWNGCVLHEALTRLFALGARSRAEAWHSEDRVPGGRLQGLRGSGFRWLTHNSQVLYPCPCAGEPHSHSSTRAGFNLDSG